MGEAPGVVVEEDAAAYDAFGGPGADAEGVCLRGTVGAVDLVEGGVVVEEGFFLVADWRWVLALGTICCCWDWGHWQWRKPSHWVLLCVLKVQTSSLTMRGVFW